jgi:hypothetical protein
MVKRRKTREKENQRGTKAKYTNSANLYYKEVISPLERAFKRALLAEQFTEAGEIFIKMREAKKYHRHLVMRKEFVRIK